MPENRHATPYSGTSPFATRWHVPPCAIRTSRNRAISRAVCTSDVAIALALTINPPCVASYSSGSVGCFLTTACCQHKGLADGCDELQTLRAFRDSYMRPREDLRGLVQEYCRVAPDIVDAVNRGQPPVHAPLSSVLSSRKDCCKFTQLILPHVAWVYNALPLPHLCSSRT